MKGPGKYDDDVTEIRERYAAEAVVLIVIGGSRGNSFCVQAPEELSRRLPTLLRTVADEIETDHRKEAT